MKKSKSILYPGRVFILTLFLILILSPAKLLSRENPEGNDSLKKNEVKSRKFELSFGSSVLFISADKQDTIYKRGGVVVPTSALLFFAEFRPMKRMRIPAFVSLPTESKQFLVNGVLVNEKANLTFGTGLEFKLAQVKISDETRMEFESGPLLSCIVGKGWNFRFAPVGAGRIRLVKSESFAMYFGSSYSLGINAWGLVYGTGYIF